MNAFTFAKPVNSTIKVNYATFVEMTQLQMNCLYNTVNLVDRKIDYLYSNLGNETIDISKIRNINDEMDKLQNDCSDKFEKLKKSCKVVS
jgi:hypothetical protein